MPYIWQGSQGSSRTPRTHSMEPARTFCREKSPNSPGQPPLLLHPCHGTWPRGALCELTLRGHDLAGSSATVAWGTLPSESEATGRETAWDSSCPPVLSPRPASRTLTRLQGALNSLRLISRWNMQSEPHSGVTSPISCKGMWSLKWKLFSIYRSGPSDISSFPHSAT